MTSPLTILLADDQIPSDSAQENEITKEEIRREFEVAKPQVDVDVGFLDDFEWFTGLLRHLQRTKGETVITARTFEDAERLLDNPRDFDIAVVDLSWWGDRKLPRGASNRESKGMELIKAVSERHPRLPLVALSQEYSGNFDLISTALERGAFPIPKVYQPRELSYRAFYAAIQYLTRGRRRSKVEVFVSHAHEDKDLAGQLVTAISMGLRVPSGAIRCTSVPGTT